MKRVVLIALVLIMACCFQQVAAQRVMVDMDYDLYGETVSLPLTSSGFIDFKGPLTEQAILEFYQRMNKAGYEPLVRSMISYQQQHQPDDWLYYQLIRGAAQAVSPKADHYIRYTLYKWYFLLRSGYDAMLSISGDTVLFYVQCDENIYDIPSFRWKGKQYVCLNYHDYGFNLDFERTQFRKVAVHDPAERRSFSYRLTRLPSFRSADYTEKILEFSYREATYTYRVRINEQMKQLFRNYPVADYQLYFSAPLSPETYASLIPQLKKDLKGRSLKNGIDYLMRFTRYALPYGTDKEHFGAEKRLLPEQTLFYEHSDCEDRAALFFALVREIYNIPMIVLAYPQHVTVAVKLEGMEGGRPIIYNGEKYYICEATPQRKDLSVGEMAKELVSETYQVAYAYNP